MQSYVIKLIGRFIIKASELQRAFTNVDLHAVVMIATA